MDKLCTLLCNLLQVSRNVKLNIQGLDRFCPATFCLLRIQHSVNGLNPWVTCKSVG